MTHQQTSQQPQVLTITDDDEFERLAGLMPGVAWLWAEQQPWIAFCSEHGDWYAVRPLTEDDATTPEARTFGPVPLDTIDYPWELASAESPLTRTFMVSAAREGDGDVAVGLADFPFTICVDDQATADQREDGAS